MCALTRAHKQALKAVPPALVNPRLLLVVYKSKGHGADERLGRGLCHSHDTPFLICCYLVGEMHPDQIEIVERINTFESYEQLGSCNLLFKPNAEARLAPVCFCIEDTTLNLKCVLVSFQSCHALQATEPGLRVQLYCTALHKSMP